MKKGWRRPRIISTLVVVFALGLMLVGRGESGLARQKDTSQSGKKYAVLVGINKYPYINPLHGCVNDIRAFEELLKRNYGFSNLVTLTDEEATRENILLQLQSSLKTVQRGDLFVFMYSGHGTLFPDAYSEVVDETREINPECGQPGRCPKGKYDSAICPVDTGGPSRSGKRWENLILDDELYEVFAEMTRKNCLVVFLSDSCHSGTLGRSINVRNRAVSPDQAIRARLTPIETPVGRPGTIAKPTKNYVVLTSSSDEETSVEMSFKGKERGLFSYLFEQTVLAQGNSLSYQSLLTRIEPIVNETARQAKGGNLGQIPQLDTRFCRPALLNGPLFALPTRKDIEEEGASLRFVVQVLDQAGRPLPNAVVLALKPETPISHAYKESDLATAGRTNSLGVFDSTGEKSSIKGLVQAGNYRVKVACPGYVSFEGNIEAVDNGRGACVFTFRLVPEK